MADDLHWTSSQSAAPIPILGEDDARALIALNQKLSTLGINDTIKLPTCVCIGDQSVGKSSLIEAISTVSVPKQSGLCTKGPIFIGLSNSDVSDWECSVYVEERYMFDNTIRNKRISKTNPLGPWKLLPEPATTLIDTTHDRDKLLDLIRKAEDVVLNPSGKQETSTTKPETFSPNLIKIHVRMRNCANLSFIDLPGVIANSGTDYHVDLVKSLAASYAKDENNIIMLTLPVNHDTSNSNSYSIIQKYGAQSHTMAVFTKVDLARDEERDHCLRTYFGEGGQEGLGEEEEEFEYGHHIVMLEDVVNSVESVPEDAFFSRPPWNNCSANTRQRLGVTNLVARIRKILFQKTAETLPGNLEQIQIRAGEIQDQLKAMPQPPDTTELPYDLKFQMSTFKQNMQLLFTSSQTDDSLSPRSTLLDTMNDFNQRVRSNAPTMLIKTKSEFRQVEDAKKRLLEMSDSKAATPASDIANGSKAKRGAANQGPYRFDLEDVRKLNKEHYSSSIPGDIEPRAVQKMHRYSVESWTGLFESFIGEIGRAINLEVHKCVQGTFSKIMHLPVYEEIEIITREYLELVFEHERTHLRRLCDAETTSPLTFNDSSIRAAEMKCLENRRQKREEWRLEVEKEMRKVNAAVLKKNKNKEPTAADIGMDPFDQEVLMTAKSRAYYDVAYPRFVDSVCQNIFAHLIPLVSERLAEHVSVRLGVDDIPNNRDRIVALMTEDSEREALRRRKISELERLQKGQAYIASVLDALNRQSFTNLHDDNGNSTFQHYGTLQDNPFSLDFETSPLKRRLTDTDFETEIDQECSPAKRTQRSRVNQHSSQNDEGRQNRARLPSRPRSVDLDE